MIKIMVFLKRRPELSHDEFIDYWKNVHAPLAAEAPGFVEHTGKYMHNYPEPNADGEYDYDGVVECWYDSLEDMKACTDNDYYREVIRPDEAKFIDLPTSKLIVTENTVFSKYDS